MNVLARTSSTASGEEGRPRPSAARAPARRWSRPARGLRRAQARPALRRPAPARRPGPRPGQPPQGAAARRAARRPRPQAPRGDAGRAQGDPARGRHHLPVRHPRPGGGADHERPDRGVQPGPDRAGRHPGRGLRAARPRRSSPASSAPPTCSPARPRARSSAGTASTASGRRSSASTPDDADAPTSGTPRRAPSRRSSTPGAATRFLVDLDAGGRLVALQQNLQTSVRWTSRPARRPGQALWRREHESGRPTQRVRRSARHDPPACVPSVRLRRSRRALPAPRVAAAGGTLLAAGCGAEAPPAPGSRRLHPARSRQRCRRSAQGEGQVNIIAWAGYAEDGSNDPKVDWVTPFEKETGCKVNTKIAGTSDEMVNLMKTGAVRRRLRLRRRLAAPHRRRRRRPGQHRAGAELRGHLRRPQEPAVELRRRRRRTASRTAGAPTC